METRKVKEVLLGIGASATAMGALAMSGCGGNNIKISPAAESPPYMGDPHASGSNPANWKEVVVAETDIRGIGADTSMIIGFEAPGSDDWHESKPINLRGIRSADFMLRIGAGPVQFRVQFVSSKDSNVMHVAPSTTFEGPEPLSQAEKKHHTLYVPAAWENEKD